MGGQLPPGVSLRDGILYHCGPVMMQQRTVREMHRRRSDHVIREEPFQWQVIRDFSRARRHRQGGMGDKTLLPARNTLRVAARGRRRGAGAGRVREEGAQCLYDERIRCAGSDLGIGDRDFPPW